MAIRSQNLVRKRIEVSFYKNHFEPRVEEEQNHLKPHAKEESNYFKSREKEKKSYKIIKNFKPHAEEGQSIISSENPKPRVEEERNIKVLNYFKSQAEENSSCKFIKNPKPSAGEDRSVILQEPFRTSNGKRTKPFPNLKRKRKEILLQNLVQKKREVT